MRGFTQSDFMDYETYWKHKAKLDRGCGSADQLLKIWDNMTGFLRRHPDMFWEIQRLLHDSVQLGYEVSIGKPHRSTDYDITPRTLTDNNKCQFCEHGYLVYNCEQACARKDKGLDCELKVREYFE